MLFARVTHIYVKWKSSENFQLSTLTHQTNAAVSTSWWNEEKLSTLALEMFLISKKALSFESANDAADEIVVVAVPLNAMFSSVDTSGS